MPAAALRRALARAPGVYLEDRLEDRQPAGNLAPGTWDAVVLWLPAADVLKLTATSSWSAPVPRLYLSWSLLGETLPPLPAAWRGRAYFLDCLAPPGFDSPHLSRPRLARRPRPRLGRRALAARHLADPSLTESVLMHLVESFSRDYFVEAVERETEARRRTPASTPASPSAPASASPRKAAPSCASPSMARWSRWGRGSCRSTRSRSTRRE